MRILLFFVLAFASCKKFEPNNQKVDVVGLYVGSDTTLYVHDKYGQKIFGTCIRVNKNDSTTNPVFFDKELIHVDEDTYSFDFVKNIDYGIANDTDFHQIRSKGLFTFSGHKLIIEYNAGELGKTMSSFRFEG